MQPTTLLARLYHNRSHRSQYNGMESYHAGGATHYGSVTDSLADIEAFQVHFGDRQCPPRCSRPPIPVGVHAGQQLTLVSVSHGKPISIKGRAASIHGGSIPSGTHCCLPAIPRLRRPRMMPTALRPPSHASHVWGFWTRDPAGGAVVVAPAQHDASQGKGMAFHMPPTFRSSGWDSESASSR